ncbi:nucleotidyltransferase family protein [Streptomyces scabiei]|uniref:nucleotidyltransferase family protein n=1 Tax=Streptomyces scabiei TaxID=1930 RepID=UPI0029C0FF7D|nr:NTP transferase domain-containing protein [Streptomyces scabiei]
MPEVLSHLRAGYISTLIPTDSVEVLVLAGGMGTRLRGQAQRSVPAVPKLLMEVGPETEPTPMIGTILGEIYGNGFRAISVLTSSAADAGGSDIETYVLAHHGHNARLQLLREALPLGTAGAVYAALAHVAAERIVIVPGDTLFPFGALQAALTAHRRASHSLTWVVTTRPGPAAQNSGRLLLNTDGTLCRVLEGLNAEEARSERSGIKVDVTESTSAGVIIANRVHYASAFEKHTAGQSDPAPIDVYRQLVPWLLRQGEVIETYDIRCSAPDLGTPERLAVFGRTPSKYLSSGPKRTDL